MKKIILLALPCLFLILACGGEFRLSGTPTAFASPTPCAETGIVRTARVRQITVDFYCGLAGSEQDLILEAVGDAMDAMPPDILTSAHVTAFTILDQGLAAEYAWLKAEGYTGSLDSLRPEWLEKHLLGRAYPRAVFLYAGAEDWQHNFATVTRPTVLHEMHHLLQSELIHSFRHDPVWLAEGGADEFTELELADLDLPAPLPRMTSEECNYRLIQLEYERADVPFPCYYLEGARAVHVLLDEYGRQTYYQLLKNIGTKSAFDRAFVATYGISLYDFYRLFDIYRISGYTARPRFSVPTPVPTP